MSGPYPPDQSALSEGHTTPSDTLCNQALHGDAQEEKKQSQVL